MVGWMVGGMNGWMDGLLGCQTTKLNVYSHTSGFVLSHCGFNESRIVLKKKEKKFIYLFICLSTYFLDLIFGS